jgi:hypothetical protein
MRADFDVKAPGRLRVTDHPLVLNKRHCEIEPLMCHRLGAGKFDQIESRESIVRYALPFRDFSHVSVKSDQDGIIGLRRHANQSVYRTASHDFVEENDFVTVGLEHLPDISRDTFI